jgi:ElaB/YqjD/DUF883 family membrane-anchored ribosome-binding protein
MINRFDDRPSIERLLVAPAESVKSAVMHSGKAIVDRMERLITSHPKESLVIAVAAGAVLGWISKRR